MNNNTDCGVEADAAMRAAGDRHAQTVGPSKRHPTLRGAAAAGSCAIFRPRGHSRSRSGYHHNPSVHYFMVKLTARWKLTWGTHRMNCFM